MGCKYCRSNNKKIDYEILNVNVKIEKELYEECKRSEENDLKKNNSLDIPDYFHALKIKKIYLGLKSSDDNFYKKYKKEGKKRGFTKRDFAHPSIYAFYTETLGYFIDYQPSNSNANNVNYIYRNQKGGLRYGEKTFKDFFENSNLCTIALKINEDKNFYEFFTECCNDDNNWSTKSFNLENNNCCDFIIKALDVLGAKLKTGNIEDDITITNEKEKEKYLHKNESKEHILPTKILSYFIQDGEGFSGEIN